MARFGIISDIHGNLEALRACVRFLMGERGAEQLLCPGDIVGYNAEPDACVDTLLGLSTQAVAGNHDLIAVGELGFERCAVRPAYALRRTRKALRESTRHALRALPAVRTVEDDIVLVHGGFRDVCQYVTRPAQILENAAWMRSELPRASVCFFGHTHEQRFFEIEGGSVIERAPDSDVEIELGGRGCTYFINPGSVDAARRSDDRRAECALFDSERRTVSFHLVPYDHAHEEHLARKAGYRMSPAEERVRLAARNLSRKKAAAERRLRAWLGR
jgi:predicted phosphodiesterase